MRQQDMRHAIELIVDFDATNDPAHNHREGGFFQRCYDHYCIQPLFVFYDDRLVVSDLRLRQIDGTKYLRTTSALMAKRLCAIQREHCLPE